MSRYHNDSYQLLYCAPPVTTMPFTMSCLFQARNYLNLSRTIMMIEEAGGDQWYQMAGNSQRIRSYARNGGNTKLVLSSPTNYVLNTWYHAANVYASATSRSTYLNGGDKQTSTENCTPDPGQLNRLSLGGYAGAPAHFEGYYAENAVWNVALTDTEIALLGKFVSPLMVRPQNLVFYLPCIRDNDKDLIGGLTLTPSNNPVIGPHPRVYYPPQEIFVSSEVGVTEKFGPRIQVV